MRLFMSKIKVIGLTGPSGSGKSSLCNVLKDLGVSCINSDKVSREVVLPGTKCLKLLVERFGNILNNDGTLNRKALAEIAFSSKQNTNDLNKITHPFIMERVKELIENAQDNGEKIIIIEAPQLFESKANEICDLIVCIIADKNLRTTRIINRDNVTENEATARLNSALDDNYYINNSDMVIYNNFSKEQLNKAAKELLININKHFNQH